MILNFHNLPCQTGLSMTLSLDMIIIHHFLLPLIALETIRPLHHRPSWTQTRPDSVLWISGHISIVALGEEPSAAPQKKKILRLQIGVEERSNQQTTCCVETRWLGVVVGWGGVDYLQLVLQWKADAESILQGAPSFTRCNAFTNQRKFLQSINHLASSPNLMSVDATGTSEKPRVDVTSPHCRIGWLLLIITVIRVVFLCGLLMLSCIILGCCAEWGDK